MVSSIFPKILALDFDGVICNGLLEYFQTTQRTYQQIWPDNSENLDNFSEDFYQLRPVIETGWEMVILLRALVLDYARDQIETDWANICQQIIEQETLNKTSVMAQLDGVRDNWIKTDLQGWLKLHQFYPGILLKLETVLKSATSVYIVTTKEGRFVQELLQQQGINLSEKNILGKEVKQPKYQTLRQLLQENSIKAEELWFVEDLLKTLQTIQKQPDLSEIKLFLADWGYNTEQTRIIGKNDLSISLLSLEKFSQTFASWIES
ncbi:HAD family hydrolase [Aphanothece sacrum]|uniref:Haloacid dehalogenase n=1 Tax=Aphanothece sacrum FPU1 TaxID=1920663 RepID=A0A401IH04_APHSA|nr:HAD hydrolase-like protein [Aphanothece sacrum]GBF80567.1 haloacid dehalogenase [Aphanothece sacrum FPU1]GBF84043.1 haloacid dehalogenase [Aphanothece sacrum FPU3]